jgi:hypothetical protein
LQHYGSSLLFSFVDPCFHDHNLLEHGISADVRAKVREQWKNSIAKGLWKGAYAASNEHEFSPNFNYWKISIRAAW